MNKAKVICVARVKNEAWIIKRFLETTSLWADHIILFDQNSEDETVKIAQNFEKAVVIENPRDEFSEVDFEHMLAEARKLKGKKLIVVLDADEFLSANILTSPEWQTMITANEGSVFNINRIDFDNNFKTYRLSMAYWFAFMDDGISNFPANEENYRIHGLRIPFPQYTVNMYFMLDIVMLHYVNVVRDRTLSKVRWYQCFEILYKQKKKLSIIKQYLKEARLDGISNSNNPIETQWLSGYTDKGIDMTSQIKYYDYWWDRKVLKYFDEYGVDRFKKANIWLGKDWFEAYKHYGYTKLKEEDFKIPLSSRIVFAYARRTYLSTSRHVRFVDRIINTFF